MKALKTKIFKTKLNFGGCLAYFLKPYFNFNNFNFFGGCLASGGKEEILHPATCILVLLLFFWGLPCNQIYLLIYIWRFHNFAYAFTFFLIILSKLYLVKDKVCSLFYY